MHGSKRICLALALACSALVAGGCSNLGAVREFAASSARMTDYRAATDHYLDSADRQLAELPAAERFDGTREQLQALKRVTARDKKDRKSTRLNSSHVKISYAVFCLKKKRNTLM